MLNCFLNGVGIGFNATCQTVIIMFRWRTNHQLYLMLSLVYSRVVYLVCYSFSSSLTTYPAVFPILPSFLLTIPRFRTLSLHHMMHSTSNLTLTPGLISTPYFSTPISVLPSGSLCHILIVHLTALKAVASVPQFHCDLGIMVRGDLSWSTHHNHICSKAYSVMYRIHRTFSSSASVSRKKQFYVTRRGKHGLT